ncbi:hypothetical protein CYFUS_009782 [Cystobacter fuscus]|uniref:DUF6968 domain-containing protein n=1 Tax=Cystobacter fuscus TaxID=43 RepID=A0A250JK91_9BACT|nr:hypothetical protein [Cystobacter fuscus]ATB44295.1 hypothetical protein CYFUS_009782 [Cystobacter fuscus]
MTTVTRLMRGRKPTGPILAERKFKSSGGARASIRVRAPARDSRTGNYRCCVEWVHSGKRELFELWGIDSMQALQLALRAAGDLVNGDEEDLRWVGSDDGYLGFPRTYPEFLPKALLRKLERMIDREIAAHARKSAAERKQSRARAGRSKPISG